MRMTKFGRGSSGQALIETILLMPLLLLILLNVINFGYFFLVALNLAAAPRAGVEYSILGYSTPATLNLPATGPPSTSTTVSYVSQQDLTGAINAPTDATIQVCSSTVGLNSGPPVTTQCNCYPSSACSAGWAPAADPEPSSFRLDRVDIDYTFSPLIPGTPFGLALLPICSGNTTCTFHRQVSMREMN
jgi:Flp pilus assembly protein TadG